MNLLDYYLIIDLEATCDDMRTIPRDRSEIIEIGAVLLDSKTLEIESEWQSFVRPVLYPRLTEFCTSLTSITQEQVDQAPTFSVALEGLKRFLPRGRFLFSSWGDYDKQQFARDAGRLGLLLPFGRDHLNVKRAFSAALGESRQYGLGRALRRAGLRFQGTAHRGIDDARNIARLMPFALGQAQLRRS